MLVAVRLQCLNGSKPRAYNWTVATFGKGVFIRSFIARKIQMKILRNVLLFLLVSLLYTPFASAQNGADIVRGQGNFGDFFGMEKTYW